MAHGRAGTFPRTFVRSQRRKTSWSQGPTGTPGSISTNSSNAYASGAQALSDGLTLVRLRGTVSLFYSSVAAAGDGFGQIAIGICNVAENAFDAGAASMPTPITDIGWDGWLWFWIGSLIVPSGTLVNGFGMNALLLEIDSKAMRKVRSTDVIVGLIQTAGEVGTTVLQTTMRTRLLDKLP